MTIKQLLCKHKYWSDYKIDLYIRKDCSWGYIRGSNWRIFTCEKCWYRKLQKLKDIHKNINY